jgi:hypothetical protein
MILQPQKDYPLVRQINNHLDVNTYYVQAIVYDADGSVVDTVNLTDLGGQRFQKRYRVPVDRSGQGAYISVVTSVYTDSGYTTKSSNYGDEETTYLIFDQLTNRSGGGGANIDYGTIRRILEEELDKREKEEKEIKFPEFPEMPEIPKYDGLFDKALAEIKTVKNLIEQLPKKKTDISPVLFGIQNLADAIENKAVTPETDLTPVMGELATVADVVARELEQHYQRSEEQKEEIKEVIVETVRDSMENTEFTGEIGIIPKRMNRPKEQKKEPVKTFDLRKFVS